MHSGGQSIVDGEGGTPKWVIIDGHMTSRRTILGGVAATAAMPGFAQSSAASPEIAVVGAGAFGAWTALHLAEAGAKVTLLDAYGPGNPRATSGDETRQIRAGYGSREMYSVWALRAMGLWRKRQQEFGRNLFHPIGRLQMAAVAGKEMVAQGEVLKKLGVPFETLTPEEIHKRWPVVRPEGVGIGVYEPDAAILMARESIQAVAEQFRKRGGTITIARAEPGSGSGRLENLRLQDGGVLRAEQFVFACGPWLRKLFPALLGSKIATPRRDVIYFGTPSGETRFSYPRLPNFSESTYYGFPSLYSRGLKICPTNPDSNFDPDTDERIAAPHQLKRARDYLTLRFPVMRDQPVVATHVCQLENTTDEHFIIDKHPEWGNVWIAGGGSGHGFKHGPVLGDYIAKRVLGGSPDPQLEGFFRLKK